MSNIKKEGSSMNEETKELRKAEKAEIEKVINDLDDEDALPIQIDEEDKPF
jgi:hypothetical protein